MDIEGGAIVTLTIRELERGLGTRIQARFQGLEDDLELPDRAGDMPRAAEFDL
jgi:hypothetical protein